MAKNVERLQAREAKELIRREKQLGEIGRASCRERV